MSDFSTSTFHLARRKYHCRECRCPIPKGERYERHSGFWEGEPFRYQQCLDCSAFIAAWENWLQSLPVVLHYGEEGSGYEIGSAGETIAETVQMYLEMQKEGV